MFRPNPTNALDVSFANYVNSRRSITDSHMESGIPDYAYGNDYALRQKMKAIPGLFPLFKALTTSFVPQMKQKYNLHAMKVGPNQFPEIHEMVMDCARKLGIGVPTVFIESNVGALNAFTFAIDDDYPIIVLYSSLVERMTPGELKAIIGHECGHIHNNHGIYNVAAEIILNIGLGMLPVAKQVVELISLPVKLALRSWNRAAEVTCDRAGMICSENPQDSYSAQAKLTFGAMFTQEKANIDALLQQFDAVRSTPVRFLELANTHPIGMRRILALQEFCRSDVYMRWRPEMRQPGLYYSNKAELDAKCDLYTTISKSR